MNWKMNWTEQKQHQQQQQQRDDHWIHRVNEMGNKKEAIIALSHYIDVEHGGIFWMCDVRDDEEQTTHCRHQVQLGYGPMNWCAMTT